MQKISGAEYPLKKIFSDDFQFVIPNYQRPYSWTTEEAGELFDDLYNFMTQMTNDEVIEPYFLGSIVLIKEEGKPRAEVIDGQQRLTTLTILFAALVERLSGDRRKSLVNYINQPGNPVEELAPQPRLTLRERDRRFFQKHIQTEGNLGELSRQNADVLTDPRKNMARNAELFLSRFSIITEEEAFKFAKFIVNHCYLVVVSTPSMHSAYRIFSVLNDRGLELLASDIVKAEIIGKIPESKQEEYTGKWENAEEALGREAFSDLLSHIRMIYRPMKQQKTILEEFREHVVAKERSPEALIDKVICPYADAYEVVLNASFESTRDAAYLNEILGWLLRIDNRDWMPPAILLLQKHMHDIDLLTRMFAGLERLASSMFIRRFGVNGRIERYGRILDAIKDDDLNRLDALMLLSDEERKDTLEILNGDLYLSRQIRTYVLLRLDSWLADGTARYQHKIITVEHVLPQTVKAGSEWDLQWPDEDLRHAWVHRLGNLVLLSRRKNSSAQNYDFATKKQKYLQSSTGVSSFALTTHVLDEKEWTLDVVEKRQRELIQVLIRGWGL